MINVILSLCVSAPPSLTVLVYCVCLSVSVPLSLTIYLALSVHSKLVSTYM